MDPKWVQMTFIVIWPPDKFFLTSCFILLANYFQFIFRWLWACNVTTDPRPRHHRPRQMTQHPQPPLQATAHRVEMGSNWMGMMGAVGHDKGDTQWDDGEMGTTTMKKWHTTHTQPHEPLLVGWIVCGMTTTTMTDDWEVTRMRETEQKKAQETLTTSLGPQVCFFLVHFHFY